MKRKRRAYYQQMASYRTIKIAVYAIALNEIKHVERWAEATKGADIRVVADTGSTDGTPEALESLGVVVYRIAVKPWRFDVARNAALALVPPDVDICLSLDMDEVPEPKFFDKVRKQWIANVDRGWIDFDTGSVWKNNRLHTRFNYHWIYPCHEIAEYYGDGKEKSCMINAKIVHQPDDTKSRAQYLPLLEMAVREAPQNPRMLTYLTREYYYHRQWEKVLESAEKTRALNGWDVEQAAVCRWAGEAAWNLGKPTEEWFDRGVQILPTQGEPWYGVALDAYRHNNWHKCLDACLKILEIPRSNHYCYEAAIWDWKVYDLAGISSYHLGAYEESLAFTEAALKGNPTERERIEGNLEFIKAHHP